MKKFLLFLISTIIILDIIDKYVLNDTIYNYIKSLYNNYNYKIVINKDSLNKNKYQYKNYSSYVKSTDNFIASNKEDLYDIYYTFLNNGFDDFTYYCDKNYTNCIEDIKILSNDAVQFSYINHLIHPYNTFKTINSKYNSLTKRIDININRKYTEEEKKEIDNKLNEIVNNLNINSYSSLEEKIKVFHDYIVNTNKYDKLKESGNSTYNSDTAIGTLFEGYSVCSGYSDTMALFLNKLNLDNVIVITDNHAWNAVKINDKWLHIDITWDDPITSNNSDILSHEYFLISTDQLLKKDMSQHNFNKDIYNFIN